jgi:hypothetical protein
VLGEAAPLTRDHAASSIREAGERAKLGQVTPHVLRRTTGTALSEARVPEAAVAAIMGHSLEVFHRAGVADLGACPARESANRESFPVVVHGSAAVCSSASIEFHRDRVVFNAFTSRRTSYAELVKRLTLRDNVGTDYTLQPFDEIDDQLIATGCARKLVTKRVTTMNLCPFGGRADACSIGRTSVSHQQRTVRSERWCRAPLVRQSAAQTMDRRGSQWTSLDGAER